MVVKIACGREFVAPRIEVRQIRRPGDRTREMILVRPGKRLVERPKSREIGFPNARPGFEPTFPVRSPDLILKMGLI